METLNCIIIEDHIPAQETLKKYVDLVPYLNLVNTYISPLEALDELESRTIDVLFLDIHLPKISGIELLKALKVPPQTILTTAFSEYAVDGFELDVVDYLLKPFSFERFLKSISKIQKSDLKLISSYIFVKNKGQIKKIAIAEIDYVEASGDFSLIYCNGRREISNTSLQHMLNQLGGRFSRCHKSFIVNIDRIEKIIGNQIIMNSKTIPLGRSFKDDFLKSIRMI